ncbi:MAG TPA: ATP-binding protein [bacterium]|nr:ATP-binding protein [bacterium]
MALNIFDLFKKTAKTPASKGNTGETVGGKTPPEILAEGMVNVRDIIAPSAIEVDFNNIKIGDMYYRTFFVSGYPRFVGANWLSPVINFDHTLLISMFYYPVKSKVILDDLRRKITELEATTMSNREKGKITDPVVEAALEDANALQEQLVKGVEKYFQFSFYITIPAYDLDELNNVSSKLESLLASLLLISKTAALQMEDAFRSSIPTGIDRLMITRNMDTTSLATTFPFTSSDLTMEEGIMYGINKHNGSLVIFDRFSMENANSVVFAKSGAGKSYFVKLEALRHLVFGVQVLIIDPEEEYRNLCEVVGGNYISFSANSKQKINPFDLSGIITEGENELGQKLISLITLLKLMIGQLNATEEAILDRALIETYRMRGITTDPETQATKEPPVMEDLYKVLLGGSEPESRSMADRLEKFIKGSMAGIFDSQSNINLESSMTVFSTKDLEETLRPIAFYMILDFIWTTIRRDLRKRILIVEEAWYLMQNADSARFIYGIAKRARKYYLGLTTVSQDVDDFLTSEYGKAVVTNSSIQMLFKQHPAAIDKVVDTFYLSEGEKRFLLSAGVGEGLFFAGANHVAIRVMASEAEHKLITTNPEEVLRLREERRKQENKRNGELGLGKPEQQVYKPYKPPEPMDEYKTFDEKGNVKPEYEAEKILGQKVAVGGNSGENVSSVPVDNAFASKDPMSKNIVLENNIDNARAPRTPQRREQVNLNSVNREKNFASNEPLNREVPGERANKTNLDSRVIELRRKMLQEDDSFMNGSPSAEDILESVEEMKKKKQGIGRINGENAISEGGSVITSRTMGEENKANNILDNSNQNQKSISETGDLPINTGQK